MATKKILTETPPILGRVYKITTAESGHPTVRTTARSPLTVGFAEGTWNIYFERFMEGMNIHAAVISRSKKLETAVFHFHRRMRRLEALITEKNGGIGHNR